MNRESCGAETNNLKYEKCRTISKKNPNRDRGILLRLELLSALLNILSGHARTKEGVPVDEEGL